MGEGGCAPSPGTAAATQRASMSRLIAVSNRVQVETEGENANRGGLAVALAAAAPDDHL